MPVNPFREDRMRRMQELLRVLERAGNCDLDWILGWGGLRWGSTEDSVMRMLIQLEKARMIELDLDDRKIIYIHQRETI